ncbi:MAG TPA: hypothetical protein VD837_06360 [Terriglobales bacterium]|nr:hypothetical protein [Terriglobales bacterium]
MLAAIHSRSGHGEQALYKAINDQSHHATLSVVDNSDTVQFGRSDCPTGCAAGSGHNTLDRSDLSLAGGANKQLPGEIIAHEALEAYISTLGNVPYGIAHGWANQYFGDAVHGSGENHTYGSGGMHHYTLDWTFQRLGVTVQTKVIVTRQPPQTVPQVYTPVSG